MGFNVGDRVEVFGLVFDTQFNGEQTTITGPLEQFTWDDGTWEGYPTEIPSDEHSGMEYFRSQYLRLVPPDDEKASWEKVEEITGWNPTVVLV